MRLDAHDTNVLTMIIKMRLCKHAHFCLVCLVLHAGSSWAHDDDEGPSIGHSTIASSHEQDTVNEMADQFVDKQFNLLEKDYFLTKLMLKYGNGTAIYFEGFEHLLERLKLGAILQLRHNHESLKVTNNSKFQHLHGYHNQSENADQLKLVNNGTISENHEDEEHIDGLEHGDDSRHIHSAHDHDSISHAHGHLGDLDKQHTREVFSECLSATVMMSMVQSDDDGALTKDMFKELCPSLLYQMDTDACLHKQFHNDHSHSNHSRVLAWHVSQIPPKVWGFSITAVCIISLVGLLGVAVIPIMQKVFYNHLLQFLVAMAVGALSGDAMLHLLPHAFSGGHGDEASGHKHAHDVGPVYKGLCGLLAIYIFFFMERIVTIITQMKQSRKHLKIHDKQNGMDKKHYQIGEKLARSDMECDGKVMSIHPDRAIQGYADQTHDEHCAISFDHSSAVSHHHHDDHQLANGNHNHSGVDEEESATMLSHNTSIHKGHGHSHSHGEVPNSVSSVAWMVILGDGIHNFSDGLAIGAAFTNSITGGISTSIAVFCHELPHEIGDFAMLLRAGMATKQAVFYNLVSSILCFFGMLIGIMIGNIATASQWVFTTVGGIFLYIALVDMLPEVSSVDTKKGEHPFFHLLLQLLGMLLGGSIMLIIALYEHDLQTMLD